MTTEERSELRAFYCKEYRIRTGVALKCMEQGKIQPSRCKSICRKNVLQIAAEYIEIPVQQITSKSRKTDLVDARRMIAGVMRIYKITFEEIAQILGDKDHTTVGYSLQKLKDYCKVDRTYRAKYKAFSDHCKQEILRLYQENRANKITQQQ